MANEFVRPNSTVSIFEGVHLDNTYNHTFYFASHEERDNLFDGVHGYTKLATIDNTMYQNVKDVNKIRIDCDKMRVNNHSLFFANYLTFKNTDYENKTFYAFVTEVNYLNDKVCELTYELDVMTTFFFDVSLGTSFVEREHSISDARWDMRIPESLETGEYVFKNDSFQPLLSYYAGQHQQDVEISLVLVANDTFYPEVTGVTFRRYDGLPSSIVVHIAWYARWDSAQSQWIFNDALQQFYNDTINRYVTDSAKSQALLGLFLYPTALLPVDGDAENPNTNVQFTVTRPNVFGDYQPFNKKLLQYPYQFFYVRDTSGNSGVYDFIFSNTTNLNFVLVGHIDASPSEMLIPLNYKGSNTNYDEAMSFANFPQLSIVTDTYKEWLASNGLLTQLSGLKGVVGGLSQMGTGLSAVAFGSNISKAGGAVSAVAGVANAGISIAQTMAKFHQALIQPNQSLTSGNASVITALTGLNMFGGVKQVTPDVAESIDNYFTMFGYACHKCKIPAQHNRAKWTYTKTIGCVLSGDVPDKFLKKIASIYDAGITFWVTSEFRRVGDYTQRRTDDPSTTRINYPLEEG